MKLLVTGAGGMLGSDVVRQGAVPLTRSDLDVTDAGAVRRAFEQAGPDVVINCAAWADVDGAESHEEAATLLNGKAAGNVAAAAAAVGAAVMYPSTDYVFDGSSDRPYVESDPVAPQSAYGRSKLAGERAVAAANERHFVVRTSWLFGVAGKNFVDTMLGLGRDRDELKVVDDQIGRPTYTGHLAEALVRLAGTDAYGVHHIAGGGEPCSWFEFATAIFREAELDVRTLPCTTAEFPRAAPRPAYSVLGSERPDALGLPDWRAGLASYLAERAPAR
ncbi:MAG: dTDP-4-dehydrorhamnose reductase [Thermoleophilaceae bacterium]|nr:dTDP-4-dehydrorhamnose reductase [Thermoleophilaceae bacterium]